MLIAFTQLELFCDCAADCLLTYVQGSVIKKKYMTYITVIDMVWTFEIKWNKFKILEQITVRLLCFPTRYWYIQQHIPTMVNLLLTHCPLSDLKQTVYLLMQFLALYIPKVAVVVMVYCQIWYWYYFGFGFKCIFQLYSSGFSLS